MTERMPNKPDSAALGEMLVAYLDGELEAEAAREVERLLASDARVEAELRRLQGAWDLLDRLPRAEVGPSFTRSTVEMVAVAVENDLQSNLPARPARRRALVAVALLCVGSAGFAGARLWPDANRQLLRDLPILEHLEALRQTPAIGFLRRLREAGLFADQAVKAGHSADRLESPLEAFSPEQKNELHRNYERFVHLPAGEQERLRRLQAAINCDEQTAELRASLAQYQHWLQQLTSVERGELMALDDDQRLARIKRLSEEEGRRLGPDDVAAFATWFEGVLPKLLPPERRAALQRELAQATEARRREIVRRTWLAVRQQGAARAKRAAGRPSAAGPLVKPQILAELRRQLSPPAQQQLDEARNDDLRRRLIASWAVQAFAPHLAGRGRQLSLPEAGEEELKRFFERDLTSAQRSQLLNLPADQMRRQLLLRYETKRAAERRLQEKGA